MTTYLGTKSLSIKAAQNFINSITSGNSNVYLAVAHTEQWVNDPTPEPVLDNVEEYVYAWRDIIGGKKVTGNDLSLVVPRINWTANTVYTAYDHRANNIFANNFYILTTDYNVYKCIANNASANSTVMPTYISPSVTNTETDGYIWKYMGTLSTADRTKYLTNEWMPVKRLSADDGSAQWQVQQAAVEGSIENIVITNNGINYTNVSNITITIVGDGSGAVALPKRNTISNSVSNVSMSSPGSGYHFANVTITDRGTGSNAAGYPVISPFYGHGYSMVEELGGSTLMVNMNITGNESGYLSTQNDYRQICLLENPVKYGNTTIYSNSLFTQTMTLTLSQTGGNYAVDETVYQGANVAFATFTGVVLDWNSTTSKIQLAQITGTPGAAALLGATFGASRFNLNTKYYDLKPYTGKILYMENISPIMRADNQTENIKLILKF